MNHTFEYGDGWEAVWNPATGLAAIYHGVEQISRVSVPFSNRTYAMMYLHTEILEHKENR